MDSVKVGPESESPGRDACHYLVQRDRTNGEEKMNLKDTKNMALLGLENSSDVRIEGKGARSLQDS